MGKTEFKKWMEKIYKKYGNDPECSHAKVDNLMIEVLESLGYDLSDFHNNVQWYAKEKDK